MDKVKCIFPECQEGHYPLGYQDYGDGEGYVVWGACPCCGGENWRDCPTCTTSFDDPSAIEPEEPNDICYGCGRLNKLHCGCNEVVK